jgi:hypothetical protein
MEMTRNYQNWVEQQTYMAPLQRNDISHKVWYILSSVLSWAPIFTQENFPQEENFVKYDWPEQIFRLKKNLKLKMFNF